MPARRLRRLVELEAEYEKKVFNRELEQKSKSGEVNESRRSRRAKKAKAKRDEKAEEEKAQMTASFESSNEMMGAAIKSMLRGPAPVHPAVVANAMALGWQWSAVGFRDVGTVKKLVQGKGFGFVEADSGMCCGEVFLHFSDFRYGSRVAGTLEVGSRISFLTEMDWTTGRSRARDIMPLSEEVLPETHTEGPDSWVAPMYSRQKLLALSKSPGARRPLKKPLPIRMLNWSHDWLDTGAEEWRDLDDESLVVKMEIRLSRESGADAKNADTFGEDCGGGWTFEEAVKANATILRREQSLTSTASTPTLSTTSTAEELKCHVAWDTPSNYEGVWQ